MNSFQQKVRAELQYPRSGFSLQRTFLGALPQRYIDCECIFYPHIVEGFVATLRCFLFFVFEGSVRKLFLRIYLLVFVLEGTVPVLFCHTGEPSFAKLISQRFFHSRVFSSCRVLAAQRFFVHRICQRSFGYVYTFFDQDCSKARLYPITSLKRTVRLLE